MRGRRSPRLDNVQTHSVRVDVVRSQASGRWLRADACADDACADACADDACADARRPGQRGRQDPLRRALPRRRSPRRRALLVLS